MPLARRLALVLAAFLAAAAAGAVAGSALGAPAAALAALADAYLAFAVPLLHTEPAGTKRLALLASLAGYAAGASAALGYAAHSYTETYAALALLAANLGYLVSVADAAE